MSDPRLTQVERHDAATRKSGEGQRTSPLDSAPRVALVTGSRRIARGVVLALAAEGIDVAFTYRRSATLAAALVEEIQASGVRALAIQANLETAQGCRQAVHSVFAPWSRLDVLVNIASRYVHRPLPDLDGATLSADFSVDAGAPLWCAQAALPSMRAHRYGRVITITDWTAEARRPRYRGYLGYYVAKSCAIALTEALALEVASAGVSVNAVAAGPIEPPVGTSETFVRSAALSTPVGRWGGASSVANAVLSLVRQDFVTGETLRVDGGRALA